MCRNLVHIIQTLRARSRDCRVFHFQSGSDGDGGNPFQCLHRQGGVISSSATLSHASRRSLYLRDTWVTELFLSRDSFGCSGLTLEGQILRWVNVVVRVNVKSWIDDDDDIIHLRTTAVTNQSCTLVSINPPFPSYSPQLALQIHTRALNPQNR